MSICMSIFDEYYFDEYLNEYFSVLGVDSQKVGFLGYMAAQFLIYCGLFIIVFHRA